MKVLTELNGVSAITGVAGAFDRYGEQYVIVARDAETVSRIWRRVCDEPKDADESLYKRVVVVSAEAL